MRNPFEFGRELSSEELVDRQQEIAAVKRAILGAGRLFLIGPRRFGKTSLLRAASEQSERKAKAVVFRYDAQAFSTLEQLASRIAADAARRLTHTVERAGEAIKQFFASVRPTASFDAAEGKWSITLAGKEGRETGPPLLVDVLHGVDRLAARSEATVALILDEFQEIVEDAGVEAEEQIRSAIQQHRHVGYVFAGSKTRLLADMVSGPTRPFYRMGSVLFLGPVPRADFAAFIERGFASGHIRVESRAADAILDAAEEVPYNVQLLAHACWEACRASGAGDSAPLPLTVDLVQRVRDTEALRLDPFYTQLWSSLTSTQRRALLAILREGGEGLASTPVARKYGMPVTTMQRAVEALEQKQIIREDQSRGAVRLRLEDPFLGAWVRLVVPE